MLITGNMTKTRKQMLFPAKNGSIKTKGLLTFVIECSFYR